MDRATQPVRVAIAAPTIQAHPHFPRPAAQYTRVTPPRQNRYLKTVYETGATSVYVSSAPAGYRCCFAFDGRSVGKRSDTQSRRSKSCPTAVLGYNSAASTGRSPGQWTVDAQGLDGQRYPA